MLRHSFFRSLLLLAVAFGATLSLSARVTESITKTFALTADGSITLSNVNGSVEIEGWDRNEVSVEAEKSAATDDALRRIRIDFDSSADRLVIKTEHEKSWKFWEGANAKVTYKLKVPAGASLKKVDVVNASIRVSGVRGHVNLDSVNGTIKAEGLASGGRFDTVNGSITAAFVALKADDKIVLDTVNGSCTVELPNDAAFTLDADSTNGRVSCDFPIKITKTGRGDLGGIVNGGGAKIVLDSVNGSLSVRATK